MEAGSLRLPLALAVLQSPEATYRASCLPEQLPGFIRIAATVAAAHLTWGEVKPSSAYIFPSICLFPFFSPDFQILFWGRQPSMRQVQPKQPLQGYPVHKMQVLVSK